MRREVDNPPGYGAAKPTYGDPNADLVAGGHRGSLVALEALGSAITSNPLLKKFIEKVKGTKETLQFTELLLDDDDDHIRPKKEKGEKPQKPTGDALVVAGIGAGTGLIAAKKSNLLLGGANNPVARRMVGKLSKLAKLGIPALTVGMAGYTFVQKYRDTGDAAEAANAMVHAVVPIDAIAAGLHGDTNGTVAEAAAFFGADKDFARKLMDQYNPNNEFAKVGSAAFNLLGAGAKGAGRVVTNMVADTDHATAPVS